MTATLELIRAIKDHAAHLEKASDADDEGYRATQAVAARWRLLAERAQQEADQYRAAADEVEPIPELRDMERVPLAHARGLK